MELQISIVKELSVIEKSKTEQIQKVFEPMVDMLKEFEGRFDEIKKVSEKGIDQAICTKAKRLRLDISQVRIKTEKARKEQKEEYLRAGKAIDGVSNILQWAVKEKEDELKAIEDHFDNLEKERVEKLQSERQEALSKYIEDTSLLKLGEMADDVWEAYLGAKKKDYEDKIKAEKEAEEKRIEDEKKRIAEEKRIRAENDKLQEEKEKRDIAESKERKDREAKEKELNDKLQEEKEAREKVEREVREKQLAEDNKKAEDEINKKRQDFIDWKKEDHGEFDEIIEIEGGYVKAKYISTFNK